MKTYIYALSILLFSLGVMSCGEEDVDVYPLTPLTDTQEDFEALSLNSRTTNLTIQRLADGEQKALGAEVVFAGAPRSSAVTYTYEIVEPTTVDASAYQSAGSGEIISGQVTGDIPIILNLDAFEIGAPQTLSLRLTGSNDAAVVSSQEVTYNFSVVCPSDLAGTYSSETTGTSTDGCCVGEFSNTASVVITGSGGAYTISDFSAGLYFNWYSIYGILKEHETNGVLSGTIQDICGTLSGTFREPFGGQVNVTGTVSKGVLTYTWLNDFGDTGTVTLNKQ
ncbi:MAG: hypothetical protein ACJA01_001910 [Saprospiraceae bacterium]|jgi:hypothetical protein